MFFLGALIIVSSKGKAVAKIIGYSIWFSIIIILLLLLVVKTDGL